MYSYYKLHYKLHYYMNITMCQINSCGGDVLFQMHEEKGVKFYLEAGVKEIVGEGGKAVGVTLPSGETLEADMVVAGVGVVPDTDFLKESNLPISKRGELVVDKVRRGHYGILKLHRCPALVVICWAGATNQPTVHASSPRCVWSWRHSSLPAATDWRRY